MVKVKCKNCGEIGYTASPHCVVCECGGRLKVIPENNKREKVNWLKRCLIKN